MRNVDYNIVLILDNVNTQGELDCMYFTFIVPCVITLYLIRTNKMQQYAGIYLLQNNSLHVSGVCRTHQHEYINL